MTELEKHSAFLTDLKELLKKHKAALALEEFDRGLWEPGEFKMVVDFDFDWDAEEGTKQLVLGSWVDKD